MRRLRLIHIALSVGALVAFNNLYLGGKIQFVHVNLLLLLVGSTVYIYPKVFLYIIGLTSWAVLLPIFIYVYKLDKVNAVLPIIVFNALIAGALAYKYIIEGIEKEWMTKLDSSEHLKKDDTSELERLVSQENEIREKELKILSLYEITKKMSGSLKFDDIFGVLSIFLKDNFAFRRCELAVLRREGQDVKLDKTYSVWHDGRTDDKKKRIDHDKLIKTLLFNPVIIDLRKTRDAQALKDLGVSDGDVDIFVAIPLMSEKRMTGILIIDNLSEQDLEKFVILSAQFALETKKVSLYETVEELALTDGLTGLYVRRHFIERFSEELYRSRRYKFTFAFLMIDIDDFKKCNDTYGHLVGDVILREIAKMMKESVREIDLVSRYGGEEFAIVLPETNRDGAKLVAERIRKRIEESVFKAYDEKLKITVSIGLAIYPEDGQEVKNIIERADAALYVAKRSGKNIVCEYRKS